MAKGLTPLYITAGKGHLEVVKLLIEQQAEVNVKTTEGWTPLYVAALCGHLEGVKLLIEQQAEVNVKTTIDVSSSCLRETTINGGKIRSRLICVSQQGRSFKASMASGSGQISLRVSDRD